jgi:long-subunit acyl-CoA synthetase (AMP-forming)
LPSIENTMQFPFDALNRHAQQDDEAIAVSDPRGMLSRRELFARVSGLAAEIDPAARVVGIFAPNGIDWAVAQLAGAIAGKIVVPWPTFFSAAQLAHVARDASIDLILTTRETSPITSQSGLTSQVISESRSDAGARLAEGFGQIIYTSGSTGEPKGVRLESGQIAWSSAALAAATGASEHDTYVSVLPLPLLLETICAVFIPALIGGKVHFDTELAEAVGRGTVTGIAAAMEAHQPTMSVLVPQLLRVWLGELMAGGKRAPASLRFVAVGGAPVPAQVAQAAWALGIPAHEGYGLSECCSVVSVNRAGYRRAGTVGRALDGLRVSIDAGEIVVDGPSIMDGYLGKGAAQKRWRTGDLGEIDADGFLTVLGRKDNLLVTAFGRNISPEWVETMLLADPQIAFCAVTGHGEPHLTAVLIPSQVGAAWFANASERDVLALVAECCSAAPSYAVPRVAIVVPMQQAAANQLLSASGRVRRAEVGKFVRAEQTQTALVV